MADLDHLLLKTSRTFALAIPRLPEPTRREVGVAYLLFRIADTFEDATRWPRAQRIAALEEFVGLVKAPDAARAAQATQRWMASPPCDNADYLELLGETPAVLAELEAFPPSHRAIVARHTLRTAEGMAGFVARGEADGSLRLPDVPALQQYCYVVAGIVGELLTDLFLETYPLASIETLLRERAVAFGEGLQLVNILKDSSDDAKDGRVYLPPTASRAEILSMARADLTRASEYVLGLQQARAPGGVVEFTALPVLLARAALDELEKHGPGSKVSRTAVALMMGKLRNDLQAGTPVLA